MAQPNTAPIQYNQQRPLTTPPHVSLGDLRAAVGLTLDQLAEHIAETGHPKPSRGHLSAIESGLRGPLRHGQGVAGLPPVLVPLDVREVEPPEPADLESTEVGGVLTDPLDAP